ncbi:carbohydrate kinase [Ascidiaceihabitans sp.]|uniref:carbohydrate kinase family protein n=1 Tax=Ascidiaceihabitans sp. TaxID=1872644 RepID=UPI0032982873
MILCCGEALIDMVPVQSESGQAFLPLPGGAIFNTAIALGRLDVPTQFFSGVSQDLFGAQLAGALEKAGVGTETLVRSDRPTTLAFVALQDGQAHYTFYDENSAGRMLGADDAPDIGPNITALYFGGISLCADPAASLYADLALRAADDAANHAVVMIDPNIRPGFIQDEPVYRKRLNEMMAVADIVKVSDEDLDWIIEGDADHATKAQHLQALGAGLVIVTKGRDGACAYLRGGNCVSVSVPSVVVVDTVGAGDTFNAGFLAHLHDCGVLDKAALKTIDAATVEHALGFAAKVAAVTVTRQGANPPYRSEIS